MKNSLRQFFARRKTTHNPIAAFPFCLLAVLCALAAPQLHAQTATFTIKGTVADSTDNTPLAGVTVTATRLRDSVRVGAFTDSLGRFAIKNVQPGFYLVAFDYVGHKTKRRPARVMQDVDLQTVQMVSSDVKLKGITVEEQVAPATMKGDTAQFNAQAFKTNKDATAEDLLRKMPGIEVQGGQVRAQGENVSRVLVDGRPFFDNDPNAVLRNLPAEMVDRVQTYDDPGQQATFSGFSDGNTSRTINIVTRADRRKGNFGRAAAGIGTPSVYRADGTLNNFNGPRRITVLGQSNNINQQNFSLEDILGGGGGGGGGIRNIVVQGVGGGGGGFGGGAGAGGFGGAAAAGNFLVGTANGISQTNAAALNFQNDWGKKAKVSGSYFYNNNFNRNDQRLERNFTLNNVAGQTYNESSQQRSNGNTHRINGQIEYTFDSTNSIIARVRATAQNSLSDNPVFGNTQRLQLGTSILQPINTTDNRQFSTNAGYNWTADVLFRHRFAKRGRTFSYNLVGGTNNSVGENVLTAINVFFFPPPGNATNLVQNTRIRNNGYTVFNNASYTEPLGKNSQMELSYGLSFNNSRNLRETTNGLLGSPTFGNIDTALTNNLGSLSTQHQPRAGYRWQKGKWQFTGRLAYNIASLDIGRVFPTEVRSKPMFYNVLPNFTLQYNNGRAQSFRFFYFSNVNLPGVTQLQDVVNNTNPLAPSVGNPELRQSVQHTGILRYSKFNIAKGSFFNIGMFGTVTQSYVANRTTLVTTATTLSNGFIVQPGAQLTQPTNIDGFMNLRFFTIYGRQIKKIKSNLNLSANIGYTRTPGFVNGEVNYANNLNSTAGITLSSNISEYVDFTIISNPSVNFVNNTLNSSQNGTYYNFNNTGRLDWRIGKAKAWLVQPEATHTAYAGYSSGFNPSFVVGSIGVGRKLFAKQQGEIKLYVFDIFNQNNNIRRNVTETYVEDAQSLVLRQYVMLIFTWTLRSFNNAGQQGGMPGMPPGMQFFMRPPQ